MIQSSRYRSLLRSLYTAVLQTNLSGAELKQLSRELRHGQLSEELAYMLDKVSVHFQAVDKRDGPSELLSEAEQAIKDNRISKSALFNVINSIDKSVLQADVNTLTVRQMLDRFFNNASSIQVKKLLEVLSSLNAPDPYLKGIAESRK